LGNGIFNRQCRKNNVIKVLAIKKLNQNAKSLVKLQIFMIALPIMVATLLVIIRNSNSEVALIPPLLGFIVTITNFTLIFPKISKIRRKSAEINQSFDCHVLKLPWNNIKLDKIEFSEIKGYVDGDKNYEKVRPCYPAVIDEVPLKVARIICQRRFLGGDGKVRTKFIQFVNVLMLISLCLSLVFAFANSLNIFQFLGNLLLPFLPAMIFTIKLVQDNSNSIKRSTMLKSRIELIWARILERKCIDERLFLLALRIQDELFEKRKSDPVILDYFYNKFSESLGSSPYSVEIMVKDYSSRVL
jgi:hypothetical protein